MLSVCKVIEIFLGDIEDIAKNFAETIIETKENNAIDDTEQKKTKAKKKQVSNTTHIVS